MPNPRPHMRRMFLPVGQGAFYCERFFPYLTDGPINVVYDCGAIPKWPVEREIKKLFLERETIHAVFISHFHEDHVNGLPNLLKRCLVKRIYYPYLDAQAKSLTEIWLAANGQGQDTALRFLQNPRKCVDEWSGLKGFTALIPVLPDRGGGTGDPPREQGVNEPIKSAPIFMKQWFEEEKKALPSLDSLDDWFYLPFNYRREEFIVQFQAALVDAKVSLDAQPANLSFNDRRKIRAVYEQVASDCNLTSMVLFSGLETPGFCQMGNIWSGPINPEWTKSEGCLYTGDYNARAEEPQKGLEDAFASHLEHIGCIQIPHHGSQRSFNDKFCLFDSILVVSAGIVNRYLHPDPHVVKKCADKKRPLQIVSERMDSRVDTIVCPKATAKDVWNHEFWKSRVSDEWKTACEAFGEKNVTPPFVPPIEQFMNEIMASRITSLTQDEEWAKAYKKQLCPE